MTENEFDKREQIIKNEMENTFPKMRLRDFHVIDMFCTIYKDKYCNNEEE